jgi:bacterioferritin (cytochrome b1)
MDVSPDDTKPDPMDVDEVVKRLNAAIAQQRRSVLQFTTASGSMFGLEVQGVAVQLWAFATEELDDLRRLIEKVTSLGGDPAVEVAAMQWSADPQETVEHLIACEDELLATLHQVIPPSGQEPRSEALEHLMEHIIMRKQNQVDWMRRAIRRP